MSISVSGDVADVDKLISIITTYEHLCSSKISDGLVDCSSSSWCRDCSVAEFELQTKYYNAELRLMPHETKTEDGVYGSETLENALISTEGFIDIVSFDQAFNSHSRQKISGIISRLPDISIRLLVSLKRSIHNDLSEEERMNRMLWALDSGFEHIEIDEVNLVEGWQNREKEGLPRLMEALHSNMWSTMKRKSQDAAHQCDVSKNKSKTESSTSDRDLGPSVAVAAPDTPSIDLDRAGEAEVSDELDNQLFGQFADVMSKAKEYRDQAVAGGVSDEERRNRAEKMALVLSSMLGVCEDDSD